MAANGQKYAQLFITYSSWINQPFIMADRENNHQNSVPIGAPANWRNRMRARNRKKLIGLALIVIACVVGCYAPEYEGPEKNTIFTANAGWDSTVIEGDTVALEGSAHHSKKELSYEWTQLSGPSVTIIDITFYWGYARFVSPLSAVRHP